MDDDDDDDGDESMDVETDDDESIVDETDDDESMDDETDDDDLTDGESDNSSEDDDSQMAPMLTFNITHRSFQQPSVHEEVYVLDILLSSLIDQIKFYMLRVYKAIVRLLPHAPQVNVIVMDFEAAMWAAARRVMPTCTLRGCAFHWAQAVWRKCQKLGLQVPYTKMDRIRKFIRLLMALPYLPKEHILPAFQRLRDFVPANCKTLRRLCCYIESTWMTSRTFPVSCWTLPLQLKLVAEKKLTRNQRSKTKRTQAKIFELWGQYAINDIRIMELLRSLGQLVGPILD
ncbi:hypothetical protein FSP39_013010 [Pinctada imbricata]|uniref:MULE transposase domain-containing protein n=1 Tax=Pinctada imbricata TaxID=66713 RepID=A0AA88XND9_PINIB|nr:hypothetical protein FSP39_013010 [Pinctada imbricata]